MAAIWYRARAGLRRGRGPAVALILFIAVLGGIVLSSIAGAIRNDHALPEFFAFARPYDAIVYYNVPHPGTALRDRVVALPQWESVEENGAVPISVRQRGRWVVMTAQAHPSGDPLQSIDRPRVVAGRLPD